MWLNLLGEVGLKYLVKFKVNDVKIDLRTLLGTGSGHPGLLKKVYEFPFLRIVELFERSLKWFVPVYILLSHVVSSEIDFGSAIDTSYHAGM